jgi:hypothetical protein
VALVSVLDQARTKHRARAGADERPAAPRAQKRFLRTPAISLYTAVVGGLLGGACFMLVLWAPKLLGAGTAGCARARLPRLPTRPGPCRLVTSERCCLRGEPAIQARSPVSQWL